MKHEYFDCHCNQTGCQFCDGGLGLCTVCGGFEGTLTTDCPGVKVSAAWHEEVYAAKRDFVNGEWITGHNVGPMQRAE